MIKCNVEGRTWMILQFPSTKQNVFVSFSLFLGFFSAPKLYFSVGFPVSRHLQQQ